MDLSNRSHLAADAALLSELSFPPTEVVAGAAFNIDEWLDFSSISIDDPLNVVAPVTPGGYDSNQPSVLDAHPSPMMSDNITSSIAISTTFLPTSDDPSWPLPDVVLLSTDSTVFYVNQYTLLSVSENQFRGLLPILWKDEAKRICFVEECATVLNTILHIFYNITSNPTCFADAATLLRAVDRLPLYGIPIMSCLHSCSHLYTLLISQAPLLPFDFYAFAAHHGIEDLAVAVSPYTLQQPLWMISEQLAERMGPIYLKRLCCLHLERKDAFEQALVPPPSLLDPTRSCILKDHSITMRNAWTEGAARCMERAAQDGGELSSDEVRSIFHNVMCDITCERCQKTKNQHLHKILMQRSLARRTI